MVQDAGIKMENEKGIEMETGIVCKYGLGCRELRLRLRIWGQEICAGRRKQQQQSRTDGRKEKS